MRHRNHSKKLAKKEPLARSIIRNLVTAVLLYEAVRTTKKRASIVKGAVDNVITVAKTKRKDLAIRTIQGMVSDENACKKVLEVLVPRYAKRSSGYTRVTPLGMRKGDGALLVEVGLVDAVAPTVVEPVKSSKKTTKKTSATTSSSSAS